MKEILWISVAVAVGLSVTEPILDPDLWWHITVGRWILSHGEVPVTEHWNMFSVGKSWVAYSWSFEVIVAWIEATAGSYGLLISKVVLAALLSLSFSYCFSQISRDWFVGLLLGVVVTAGCFNNFTLRPQSLVWLYLSWGLLWADRIDRNGLTRGAALALILVMSLWANTHITAVLGLFAILAWSFEIGKIERSISVAGLCAFATLLTPYFGAEWFVLMGKTAHPFAHASIAEFKPANILQYSFGFLLFLFTWLLGLLHHRPTVLSPAKLLVGGVFIVGGLAIVKFIPFGLIVIATMIARIWRESESVKGVLGNLGEGIERLRALMHRIPREGLAFVFLCIGLVSCVNLWRNPVNEDVTPVRAVDFFLERNLPHPVLNDFGKGGYMMYRLSDDSGELAHKVSIDGRTNVTPPEVWRKFLAAFNGSANWSEYIDIVNPRTILWRTESPLSSILLAGQEWCLVYRSGDQQRGYLLFVEHEYYRQSGKGLSSENCGVV